eukprot:TRINITY_DN3946_c0_g2_i1.p1 TRINITY_DN3946_c0_g2~~TRINITY_DN3946_c0_g2_i1.p1  ORF type:complete len:349 (+),score=75.64 TRINITY_DN3946_c0_g2_i1:81-1127(+)
MMFTADWFTQTFGFQESTGSNFQRTKDHFEYDPESGILKSDKGKQFKAGKFKTPSLAELRRVVKGPPAELKGNLRVMEVIGDVADFHVKEDNNGALFQAASQFNCLEHTSERGIPENGIKCYSNDRTQGPACAIACAPGTIVRNYFGKDDGAGAQRKDYQVENLKEVESALENEKNRYFNVVSGYTMASSMGLKQLSTALNRSPSLQDDVVQNLRIGVQEDTQVTSYGFGSRVVDMPNQIVTQAYCSAISVSYSRCVARDWEAFARLILESAYLSTMYAAAQNAVRNKGRKGCRKVFLTALGGGVFGNEMEWIRDAMQGAFEQFKDWNLEVYIISYSQSDRLLKGLER